MERGGKKKTRQKTRLRGKSVTTWRVDADVITKEPAEFSEDASGAGIPRVASKLKQLKDVRERPPSSDPPQSSFNPTPDEIFMAESLHTFRSAICTSGTFRTGEALGVGCLHWQRAPEEEEELQTGSQGKRSGIGRRAQRGSS